MLKKILAMMLAVIMCCTLFAACGSQAQQAQTKPAETEKPAAAPAEPAKPAGEIIGDHVQFDTGKDMSGELNIWFYEDGKAFIEPLFEDYQKYRPNVKLNVTYIPWGDYWKKVPVAVSSGNGPDLFYFHNMYHNLMVDGGLMRPYSDELLNALRQDYKNIDDSAAADGNIYYVGVGAGHAVIFYNKALWAEAGLTEADFPETWEQLRELAISLTKKNGDKIEVAGFNYNPGSEFMYDWSYLSGRFLWSEDGSEILINNDDYKKTAQFFFDLYQKDGVCNPQFPEYMQSFKDGTTAMLWNHPFYAGVLRRETPDLDFGVFPLPKFEGKARNWHYNNPDVSMGINSSISDEQVALAEDLLTLFFADEKYTRAWCAAQVLAPTKISLENDETLNADPVIQVLSKDLENTLYLGPAPAAAFQDMIQNLMDPVLKGGADLDDALEAAANKVRSTLADLSWAPNERKCAFADEMK